ncbi:glycosyltransferase [Paracoccaceae bacterium Fryx2]|nr:glycosyltransferase [Paracoccaceae bacterium Fryx2]
MTAPIIRLLPHSSAVPVAPQPWPARHVPPSAETLGVSLLRDGLVTPHHLVQALALNARNHGRLADILLARGMVPEDALYDRLAQLWQAPRIDPAREAPDPRLIDRLGAAVCLRDRLLPWRQVGAATVIATARPEDFERQRPRLTEAFGPVVLALAPAAAIETALRRARGAMLAHAAETRVPPPESCRDWGSGAAPLWGVLGLMLLIAGLVVVPVFMAFAITIWTVLTLVLATTLKSAAALSGFRRPPPRSPPPIIARLPVVSVMVAMYREVDIAPRLVRRLGRLEYPRDLLDILLVVEETDSQTRAALASADLPPWMRVVVVPDGQVQTKPRALNFALDQCRGSIVGVYDAEDAPEPDQIRRVVDRFHQRGADVACLQGVLDFYNPRTNWLSRCFTVEYAAWFRIILPGLERLGLPIPLGGTTLFFRRAALEKLGGWDSHNVTEDADLGIRLARHGYRTELIDTVTEEEANCRALPWVKQRSRWLKGYMMTWSVHNRDPALLWRQLGARKFIGFQVFFLSTLSQFLLAPVLWSFWLVPLGVPHPVADVLPPGLWWALVGLFLTTEAMNIAVGIAALRMTRHRLSPLWVPTLHFYFPLGALASYKAAWEMVARPFYWDKTSHGHFDPIDPPP